ncbi:hypothetical protein KSP40_PGU018390 [Platanthera guangdongensis]|uniref:Reverse transcriptase zinc-binding domain-containing protein n=1 Tax=Platanthera guangdongensis TaxID=2320717 RepID=A0ABR2M9W9_9ASPA
MHPDERSFWWRLSLDAIPTRTWLAHRGIAIETNCPWGCIAPESRDHLLGECSCLQVVGKALQRWGLTLPRVSSWTALMDGFSNSVCSSTFTLHVLFAAGRSLLQWDSGRTEMAALAAIQDYLPVDCFDASGVIIEGDCLHLIKYCQRCFDSRLWDAHFPDADVLGFLFELPRVMLRHVPRAANQAVDFCSRHAISCTFQWTCFEDFPLILSEVVQRDQTNILVC